MEGDLQAAAIAYSNIDKVVEMQESTLQKQKIKFRFDMAKLQAKQAGDRALEKLKNKNKLKEIDYEAAGGALGLKLQEALGGSKVEFGQAGSVDLEKDDKGNTILDDDFDALAANEEAAARQFDGMKGDMVDNAMDAYINIFASNQKGGIYTVTGEGYSFTGNRQEIKKQFLNHSDKIESFFTDMQEEMVKAKASTGASKSNGGAMFYARNNGQDYNALYDRMNTTYTKRQGLDGALSFTYDKANENLIKLLKLPPGGASRDHEDLVRVLSQSENLPKIFALGGKEGDPHTKLLTEEEYVKAFQDWAKENGQSTDVEDTIFDTSRALVHNSNERTQLSDGTNAGFGYGQDLSQASRGTLESLAEYDEDAGYEADSRSLGYEGEFKFQPELAALQARKLYALQKGLVNSTLNGSMNRVQEEMYNDDDGDSKPATYIPMFDEVSINQIMLGIDASEQNAGDVEISPTRTVNFDPLMLTEEGVDMMSNLNRQLKATDSRELYFLDGNFITEEQGNYDMADLVSKNEEDEAAAKRIFLQNYLTDVMRMQAKGATKSNYPKATISYSNNIVSAEYLEDGEEDANRIGAYKIQFGADFIDQYVGSDAKMDALGIGDADVKKNSKRWYNDSISVRTRC